MKIVVLRSYDDDNHLNKFREVEPLFIFGAFYYLLMSSSARNHHSPHTTDGRPLMVTRRFAFHL